MVFGFRAWRAFGRCRLVVYVRVTVWVMVRSDVCRFQLGLSMCGEAGGCGCCWVLHCGCALVHGCVALLGRGCWRGGVVVGCFLLGWCMVVLGLPAFAVWLSAMAKVAMLCCGHGLVAVVRLAVQVLLLHQRRLVVGHVHGRVIVVVLPVLVQVGQVGAVGAGIGSLGCDFCILGLGPFGFPVGNHVGAWLFGP